jgi:DNA polymerase I-like protein with 3'-5' exonuclease and polymerase domains
VAGVSIELLRAFLPPIHDDYKALSSTLFDVVRVVDLEWHSEDCTCGRALPLDELETIGVGNDQVVVQVDWQSLDTAARNRVRAFIPTMVEAGVTIYHNAISDIKILRKHGFKVTPAAHARLEDTMLADSVLFSEEDHDLGDLNRRLGRLPDFKHLRHSHPVEYNAGDLVGTYWVWKAIEGWFAKDPQARSIYRQMSIPFIDLALEREEAGIAVDGPVALKLFDKYLKRIREATMLARAYTGNPLISLSSPQQMQWWIYGVYGMPEQRKRGKPGEGGPLTLEKDALAELRTLSGAEWDEEDDPTLEQALYNLDADNAGWGAGLIEAKYLFTGAQQRLTHYVLPCLNYEGEGEDVKVIAPKARIHPRCKIHGQASGRVGYVEPALPQMKGETAALICPDPGRSWVGHDWSNIETWLLGALAGDELILEAKAKDWDTHVVNFCDMTGTPYPPVMTKAIHTAPCTCTGAHDLTMTQAIARGCPAAWREALSPQWLGSDDLRRTFSKRFVYRLHYRGKAKNAGNIPGARALRFDVGRLVAASEGYLAKHQAIVDFWARVEAQADAERLSRTFKGRPRRLTDEYRNSRNRKASNHPMQGGVADIWIETCLLVKAAAPWASLVYGAYDSMVWDVPTEREAEFLGIYAPIVERTMGVCSRAMSFPASYKIRRGVPLMNGEVANG